MCVCVRKGPPTHLHWIQQRLLACQSRRPAIDLQRRPRLTRTRAALLVALAGDRRAAVPASPAGPLHTRVRALVRLAGLIAPGLALLRLVRGQQGGGGGALLFLLLLLGLLHLEGVLHKVCVGSVEGLPLGGKQVPLRVRDRPVGKRLAGEVFLA